MACSRASCKSAHRCQTDHTEGMPPHTDEKPRKALWCAVGVLRQCLSLACGGKQSHWFLILIPVYRFSPIDHLSVFNETEGLEGGRVCWRTQLPPLCGCLFFFFFFFFSFSRLLSISLVLPFIHSRHSRRWDGEQWLPGDTAEVNHNWMPTQLWWLA